MLSIDGIDIDAALFEQVFYARQILPGFSDFGGNQRHPQEMKSIFIVFRIEQPSPIGALPGGHQCVLRHIDQTR
jgi:hypothetical protein